MDEFFTLLQPISRVARYFAYCCEGGLFPRNRCDLRSVIFSCFGPNTAHLGAESKRKVHLGLMFLLHLRPRNFAVEYSERNSHVALKDLNHQGGWTFNQSIMYERGNYSPADHSYVWLCRRKVTSDNVGSWLHDVLSRRLLVVCRGGVSWEGGLEHMRKIRVERLRGMV